VARLAALVPPPRTNTVRYHGILAPCAGWRDVILRDRSQVSSAPPRSRSCPCQPNRAPGEAAQDSVTAERDGPGFPCAPRYLLLRGRACRQQRLPLMSAARRVPPRPAREGSHGRSFSAVCSPWTPSNAIAAEDACGSWQPSTNPR
jgi:hypothetical protein